MTIRTLAVSAEIQREQGSPTCAAIYQEAFDLANATGNPAARGTGAFNLGHAYKDIADLRNLDEAERRYRRSLDLLAPADRFSCGQCVGQLGLVALERFGDALTAKRPIEELARHLTEAARLYEQALDMVTVVTERGIIHNQLGIIYRNIGDIDRVLHHYPQGIRSHEQAGDVFSAQGACRAFCASYKIATTPAEHRTLHEKKARARPESASAPGLSPAIVLHAESTTQSALSLRTRPTASAVIGKGRARGMAA